ncbi:MAG: tetratricopeptide repeat protein [Deltaproteobacteria bacterium]|nr:tetratricopeptide repeat protein [Deltaproteobacteria bacterium]
MKPSFLLVDNNLEALKDLTEIVTQLDCDRVDQANNAAQAWQMLRLGSHTCVISELDMPDMSGLALLKIVRSDDRLYDTAFFLSHGAFTKVKVVMAGQEGVTGLFVKPFDAAIIHQKFSEVIEHPAGKLFKKEQQSLEQGLALMESKSYEKALTVFDQLVSQGESAEVYYNIGYIKTGQEKYPEALEAFQKATALDRLFAKAFEAMGRVYRKLGQTKDAEQYLQKAADIYLTREKTEDAEDILNDILQFSPDTINVYNSLGVLHRKKGDYQGALKSYQKALRIHPDQPQICYNIGRLHLEMKNVAKAKSFFQDALKMDPGFSEVKEILEAIELGAF